jgi:hypothetical protein
MATGLKIPVGVTGAGGAAMISGDANDVQVISVALGDDDNQNAFQQEITLGEFMIFEGVGEATDEQILRRIRSIFRDFRAAQRYKLINATIDGGEEEGERVLTINYLSIESDEEKVAKAAVTGSGFRLVTEER